MENRCVCCGEIVPEGTQVCRNCNDGKTVEMDAISSLTSLPADDGNFKSVITRATAKQILIALGFMQQRGGHDKSRIAACKRELKCRDRTGKLVFSEVKI